MSIQVIITIVILVAIIALAIYLFATKQWTKLREYAYALMLSAERIYEANEGEKKFEAVFKVIYYSYIPNWLKLILTEQMIKTQLQAWYEMAKDYLKDGILGND